MILGTSPTSGPQTQFISNLYLPGGAFPPKTTQKQGNSVHELAGAQDS